MDRYRAPGPIAVVRENKEKTMIPAVASTPGDTDGKLPKAADPDPGRERTNKVEEGVLVGVVALVLWPIVLLLLGLGAAITIGVIVSVVTGL